MSRSRELTVGRNVAMALLASSALAVGPRVGFTPRDRNVIENRGQAMPKGAQRAIRGNRHDAQARNRAAAAELVRISNQTLVVAHLHPRWLRAVVEDAMNQGAVVTHADVDRWRAMGETEARVGMFHGDFGG